LNRLGKVLFVAALLLSGGCEARDKTAPPSPLQVQPADRDRVRFDLFAPDASLASGWRVAVQATYNPVNLTDPGTTLTTTSRRNCRPGSNVVFVPVPSFRKCENMVIRSESMQLPASQVSLAGERSIDVDFAPLLKVRGAEYRIASLNLSLLPCAQCKPITQDVTTDCYTDERQPEMLTRQFLLNYRKGVSSNPKAAQCGLDKGDWPAWTTRQSVQERIRSHFGEKNAMISSELLDSYGLIPTPDKGWVYNPTANLKDFSYLCLRPAATTYRARLEKSTQWPYDPNVEVSITLDDHGGICLYDLRGTDTGKYTSDVRIVYVFIDGHLRQVVTDEPKDLRRTWRWVDDQPMEYIQRENHTSVAGSDDVLYWHKIAAQYWPKQMDYKPDFKAFAQQQAFALALIQRYPPQLHDTAQTSVKP
jgi:hypothetical protein